MRFIAYLLILCGIIALLSAAKNEYRGVTTVINPARSYASRPEVVQRAQDPKLFRGAMQYQWGRGVLLLVCGLLIRSMFRRADRLDPFSPDFDGIQSIDEMEAELKRIEDRTKEREQ